MAIYQLDDRVPDIHPTAWVHEDASVIGGVFLHENTSVWPNVTIRGDNAPITVGARSNIQDGSVLHSDFDAPLTIGTDVTIGHMVMLHGCTIGDGSLVGIGAVVLNNAKIGRNCMVGAGSVVTEGKEFPDNSLILGSPAKVVRELTPAQAERVRHSAEVYHTNATRFRDGLKRIG